MKPEIKRIRESKTNFSQEQMAEKMNLTQSAYARFEGSKTKIDLKRLENFANAVGMSFIDVLTYPDTYINIKDIGKAIYNEEPEVIVQIKVKEKKKNDVLNLIFDNKDLEILKT